MKTIAVYLLTLFLAGAGDVAGAGFNVRQNEVPSAAVSAVSGRKESAAAQVKPSIKQEVNKSRRVEASAFYRGLDIKM